jgi:hypothetical protein
MYITSKIVFVEVPKTGSTYIDQVLIDLLDGQKVGKHNYPHEESICSGRSFIASIRDPYLSNAIYDQSVLGDLVGLYTFRYLWLVCRNRHELYSSNCPATYNQLVEWERENCYVDYFIQTENMVHDLLFAPEKHENHLSDEQRSHIKRAEPRNVSNRYSSFGTYYNRASALLLARKDRLIFEKFGYSTTF